MKRLFILCCITLLAIAPLCLIQGKPAKAGKPAANESTISDLEKSAWEAYKNKQADAFKALMSKDYYGVYAEGVKTLDTELADMAKSDLRDYSFSDVKVVFPHPKMAVMTYKAKMQATARSFAGGLSAARRPGRFARKNLLADGPEVGKAHLVPGKALEVGANTKQGDRLVEDNVRTIVQHVFGYLLISRGARSRIPVRALRRGPVHRSVGQSESARRRGRLAALTGAPRGPPRPAVP